MERKIKEQVVQDLGEKLSRAAGITLVDFTGLDVAGATQLRAKCREASVDYQVVKNTLARRALSDSQYRELLDTILNQPTGMAIGYDDPFIPIKVMSDFAKGNDHVKVKGAVVEGRFYGAEQTKELAKLPSKTELVSQLLRCVQGPLAGLAGVCNGILRELAGLIQAIHDKKAEEK